jgi:hypothetical protein
MNRYHRIASALLLALVLLAGCDVSGPPTTPSPLPTAGAIPNAPTAIQPLGTPVPNGAAYPAYPAAEPTVTPGPSPTPSPFPPGYVPPTPQP